MSNGILRYRIRLLLQVNSLVSLIIVHALLTSDKFWSSFTGKSRKLRIQFKDRQLMRRVWHRKYRQTRDRSKVEFLTVRDFLYFVFEWNLVPLRSTRAMFADHKFRFARNFVIYLILDSKSWEIFSLQFSRSNFHRFFPFHFSPFHHQISRSVLIESQRRR